MKVPALKKLLVVTGLMLAGAAPLSSRAQSPAPEGTVDQAGALHPQLLLKSLERRLGTNPFDPYSLNNLAVIKLAEDDPFAAAELLARAQRLAPDNPVIAENHARLTRWLGERRPQGEQEVKPANTTGSLPPEPPPIWPRP